MTTIDGVAFHFSFLYLPFQLYFLLCLFGSNQEMPKKKKSGPVAADASADDDYDPDALLQVDSLNTSGRNIHSNLQPF